MKNWQPRQSSRLVRELGVGRVLVLNAAVGAIAGAGARAVRVLAVRTSELDHEVFDDAVKVEAVVEAFFGEADEVARCDGHLVREQLDLEGALRRIEGGCRVPHAY